MSAIETTPLDAPVRLVLDVWDIDENYPSLKLSIELVAPHPTGTYNYTANDIWFSTSVLDDFVASLTLVADARNLTASLADLSDHFQLAIVNEDGKYSMRIRAHEPKTGLTTGDLAIRCTVDRDTVQFMLAAFRKLPMLQSKSSK